MRNFTSPALLALLICFLLIACQPAAHQKSSADYTPSTSESNPPSEGFDSKHSDPQAIEIADQVMEAMGGRAAWDETRYLQWNFFGSRTLTWDKWEGRVRIEYPKREFKAAFNVHTLEGKVALASEQLTHPDSVEKYLKMAHSIWINDSYWLVMPFKLKDSGVTLIYAGEDTVQGGALADVLQLTFYGVGDTPANKYDVYVDKENRLVRQWAFYNDASQDTADFVNPWNDYQQYGKILLSGDRGRSQLSGIAVFEEMDDAVFEEL